MAVTLVDRAWCYTPTTGTGTLALGSALAGYQTFATAGVANNAVVPYEISDGPLAWETGTGTFTTDGHLTRTLRASSTGSLLSLSGSATVYVTPGAVDLAQINSAALTGRPKLNGSTLMSSWGGSGTDSLDHIMQLGWTGARVVTAVDAGGAVKTMVADGDTATLTQLVTTGNGTNMQFGSAASTGIYGDGTNLCVRGTNASGAIYFQSPAGASNWAAVGPGGFSSFGDVAASNRLRAVQTTPIVDFSATTAATDYKNMRFILSADGTLISLQTVNDAYNAVTGTPFSINRAGDVLVNGTLTVSKSNITGGGIIFSDDGDFVDMNDGFLGLRFGNGIKVYSGNKSGVPAIYLNQNGWITSQNPSTGIGRVTLNGGGNNSRSWSLSSYGQDQGSSSGIFAIADETAGAVRLRVTQEGISRFDAGGVGQHIDGFGFGLRVAASASGNGVLQFTNQAQSLQLGGIACNGDINYQSNTGNHYFYNQNGGQVTAYVGVNDTSGTLNVNGSINCQGSGGQIQALGRDGNGQSLLYHTAAQGRLWHNVNGDQIWWDGSNAYCRNAFNVPYQPVGEARAWNADWALSANSLNGAFADAYDNQSVNSSFTFDFNAFFKTCITMVGNTTFTFANWKNGRSGRILIRQDGTGNRIASWSANNVAAIKWAGGVVPALSTAANAIDLLFYEINYQGIVFLSLIKGFA